MCLFLPLGSPFARLFSTAQDRPNFGLSVGVLCTFGWQIGEALALAPSALAVADVEADRHRAGKILTSVRRDLHQQHCLHAPRHTTATTKQKNNKDLSA